MPSLLEALQRDGFANLTVLGYPSYTMAEPGRPAERIRGLQFSSDMMATFGIQPLLGRAADLSAAEPRIRALMVAASGPGNRRP